MWEKFCFLSPCTQLTDKQTTWHCTFFRALPSSVGGVTGFFFFSFFLVYKFCAFNQLLQLVYSKTSCSQGSCFPNLQWKMYIVSIIFIEHNKHMDNGICFRSHCNQCNGYGLCTATKFLQLEESKYPVPSSWRLCAGACYLEHWTCPNYSANCTSGVSLKTTIMECYTFEMTLGKVTCFQSRISLQNITGKRVLSTGLIIVHAVWKWIPSPLTTHAQWPHSYKQLLCV